MWVVCNLRRRAASSASWRSSATPLPTTISLSSQPVVSLTACLLLLKTNLKSNDQEMTKTAITFPIDEPVDAPATVTFWHAFRLWLKLGFIGFGGPAGQISLLHRERVEQRRSTEGRGVGKGVSGRIDI